MSSIRNMVHEVGYYPDPEKMGKSVSYKEGDGDKKKSFFRGKISVKRDFKDKDGNTVYDFLPFKAFGSQADFIHNYAKGGDIIAIDGQLRMDDNYEKDGEVVYGQMYILADKVGIISSKNSDNEDGSKPASKPAKKAESKSSSGASSLRARLQQRRNVV